MDPGTFAPCRPRRLNSQLEIALTFASPLSSFQPRPRGVLRSLGRGAMTALGVLVVILGILIAPLPGPGGVPVIALGLVLILRSSFWAKRQFIRAQYARPKYVYPFRRLLRKNPDIAPVFWQQALRAEKLVLRRNRGPLGRLRKRARRIWRRTFP